MVPLNWYKIYNTDGNLICEKLISISQCIDID